MLRVVAASITLALAAQAAHYSAVRRGNTFKVVSGVLPNAPCKAETVDANNSQGWSTIVFESNSGLSDNEQVRACGFLEGFVLFDRIYASKVNTLDFEVDDRVHIEDFLQKNRRFIESHNNNHSEYWRQVRLVYAQMDAITEGCAAAATPGKSVTAMEMHMLNAAADIWDLMGVIERRRSPTPAPIRITPWARGHCSVLIRHTDDDLVVSHTTWATYSSMVRSLKTYRMAISGAATGSVSMSGSPGAIASIDDWYILGDSRLVVTETTNSVYNGTLFELVSPQSVLYWVRATVASRLATDGQSWVKTFHHYDSYTYNNQWMVVDMNKYNQKTRKLSPGTLTISESAAGGHWKHADVTDILRDQGFWISYNSPHFEEIYNVMGYSYVAGLYGDIFTTDKCPRALIFKRDAPKTHDVATVRSLVRSNNWLTDSLSGGYPGNALAARYDLKGGPDTPGFLDGYYNQAAYGCTDGKVTSANLLFGPSPRFSAIYGPPVTPDCPPFEYAGEWADTLHVGQPDSFNFDWFDFEVPW